MIKPQPGKFHLKPFHIYGEKKIMQKKRSY